MISRLLPVLSCVLFVLGCGHGPEHYLQSGDAYFSDGKYGAAVLEYRNALQQDPKLGGAAYKLGLAHIELGNGSEAYAALVTAVELMPDNVEAKAKLADLALNAYSVDPQRPQALYDRATLLADELLAADAASHDGLHLKGRLALLDDDSEAAIEFLKRAEQAKPGAPAVRYGLFQALCIATRCQEAASLALEWIDQKPDSGALYDLLYRFYVAENRIAEGERILKLRIQAYPGKAEYVVQLAGHYAWAEEWESMQRTLDQLLQQSEKYPNALLRVGDFYLSLGRLEDALRLYRKGSQNSSEDAEICERRMARVLLRQGRTGEASKILQALEDRDPDSVPVKSLLAAIAVETGESEKVAGAVGSYQEMVAADPGDPRLHYGLGRAYLALGNRTSAQEELQEAARLDPAFIGPRLFLASISLGGSNPTRALSLVEQVLQLQPGNPSARFLKSCALIALGNNRQAHDGLERLARDYPHSADVRLQLALLAISEGRPAEAEGLLNELKDAGSRDSRVTVVLAEAYLAREQRERALKVLRDALVQSPDSPVIRRLLAGIAAQAGKWDEAIAEYRKLADASPDSAAELTALGDAYRLAGDYDAATRALERAMQLDPRQAMAAKLLASIQTERGQFREAKTNYRTALQLQPNDVSILNNLAFLIAETGGDLGEALTLSQRASMSAAGDPNINDTLGWIYLKRGMTESALQVFRDLVREYPDNPTYRYHLGATLLNSGEAAQGTSELEAALARAPSADEEQAIRKLLADRANS